MGGVWVTLVLLLLCIVWVTIGVVVWWKCASRKEEEEMLEVEEQGQANEWFYTLAGDDSSHGPFSTVRMRNAFENHKINRETRVRLVWQTESQAVSVLFPTPGAEFVDSPLFSEDAAKTQWHRHSVLASQVPEMSDNNTWFYKDPEGDTHGPFETGKMRHWYLEHYFTPNTLASLNGKANQYFPIAFYFPNIREAFAVPPADPGTAALRVSAMQKGRMSAVPAGENGKPGNAPRQTIPSTVPKVPLGGDGGPKKTLVQPAAAPPAPLTLAPLPSRVTMTSASAYKAMSDDEGSDIWVDSTAAATNKASASKSRGMSVSPSKEVTSSSAPSPPISLGSPSSANGSPVAASTIGKGDSQDAEGEKKKKKRTVRKKLASDNATFQDDIAVQGEDGASLDSPKEENEEKKEKKDKKRRKEKKDKSEKDVPSLDWD